MTDPMHVTGLIPGAAGAAAPAGKAGAATGPLGVPGPDFKSVLFDSLDAVNRLQTEADRGVERLLTGETDNVAEVLTAVNKAGIAFDLLMEIRNKLTEAYLEIQRMQV
jgi:flagellar hook-basal body complex protein FliE